MWAWAMEQIDPRNETQGGHNHLKTFHRWAHDIVEGVREEHGFCDWYWFLHGYFLNALQFRDDTIRDLE